MSDIQIVNNKNMAGKHDTLFTIEIEGMKKDIIQIKETICRIERRLDDFIIQTERRYEDKGSILVYKKLTWIIASTLLIGIVGVIFYIFEKVI